MSSSEATAMAAPAGTRRDPGTFIIALSLIIMALTFLALLTTQGGVLNF